MWELFWPLMQGAKLAIAAPGAHQEPARLSALVRQHHVTMVHFVPSMLQVFVDCTAGETLPSLRKVMCSGEALPIDLQRTFLQGYDVQLHNLYGPTEAAIDVSDWACRDEDGIDSVPIGRPIWNTQLYILDADLNPVPVGVAGELYIGGVGLARGYHARTGLTAERFVPHPMPRQAGERVYRTGDLARWRTDGVIEYLGRVDTQVKVRGFRIELGEIEAQLRSYPEVREALVIAREDASGKHLVGYLVLRDSPDDLLKAASAGGLSGRLLQDLTRYLLARLPEYMVPTQWVQLTALPLTPNGKLDRRALPPPHVSTGYIAPRTATERTLAAVWAEVLCRDRIGVTDNFFALGGDSI